MTGPGRARAAPSLSAEARRVVEHAVEASMENPPGPVPAMKGLPTIPLRHVGAATVPPAWG